MCEIISLCALDDGRVYQARELARQRQRSGRADLGPLPKVAQTYRFPGWHGAYSTLSDIPNRASTTQETRPRND
jgi:hypothetical protein